MLRGLKKPGYITRPVLCTSIDLVCVFCLFLVFYRRAQRRYTYVWLRGSAILGAWGGRYTFLSVEHGELDRNYAPSICDWLYGM